MRISAVILTRNEAKNLKDCVDSLKFCEEIVVIDDYSEDDTVRIAESSGVKVYSRRLNSPLLHYSHSTLHEFIAEVDWYSSLHSEANLKEKKKSDVFKIGPPELGKYFGRVTPSLYYLCQFKVLSIG